ncbi:leucine-rich repeat protein 1 [Pseudorasbora parva]|uniref:leucine-rich repeat protein 1 n=1 Tax=Pseudorasbora parva TaxID=51549 RepID=UPI00351DDE90
MKLQCDVEVVNQMLPTCGLRNKGRSSRAVLSVGRHGDSLCLLICTAKDRSGSRYKLKENIEKFFTWFVEEGKATIRLKEPAVDICLSKADSSSLKSFLSAARLAHRGCSDPSSLSALGPARVCEVKPQKKLSIQSQKAYPLRSGFPASLEQLQVWFCRLTRVDPRVLALRGLRRLDLSHNRLRSLPAALGELRLVELLLHSNRLEAFGDGLCVSELQNSLQHLDLSRNHLTALPRRFCQLQQLMNLRLDHNRLRSLPFHTGRLARLRFLSAAHNQLSVLPAGFRSLSLENLDLFGNPFTEPNALEHSIHLSFPLSLQELTSRAVVELRIPLGPQLLPFHLCDELSFSKVCECGSVCVNSFIQTAVSMNLHLVSHSVVLVDSMGGTEAPVLKHFCSLSCYCQFMDSCVQRDVR